MITQEAADEMMEYRSNAVNAGSLYARDFQRYQAKNKNHLYITQI